MGHDPADFDLVVIGTPVWAARVAPPVRSFIEKNRGKLKNVALFCTEGSTNGAHALGQAAELIGSAPRAELIVTEAELASGAYRGKVEEFVKAITAAAAAPAQLS